jgi:hypothetical protein
MAYPLGGVEAKDTGAPTTNAKKHRRQAPWEVPELKIQERSPSTLENVDGGPPGGAKTEDPGGSTTNAKKHRRWTLHHQY